MQYVLVEWSHDDVDEPTQIYSELDGERREVRKVEFYKNGLCFSYGGERGHFEALNKEPFPANLLELCREDVSAHAIPAHLFYEVWNQTQERPDGFMGMFY